VLPISGNKPMKTRSRFLSFPIFVNFASYDDVIPLGGAARAIPSDVTTGREVPAETCGVL
jgi:hypothetical protein